MSSGERFHDVAATLQRVVGTPTLPANVRARHLHTIRGKAAAYPPRLRISSAGGALRRRIAVALATAGLVLALGSGFAVAAANSAMPGDDLYGLKRAMERVQLALPGSAATRVERRLALANRRLEEMVAVPGRSDEVSALLEEHRTHLRAAHERAGDDPALQAAVAEANEQAQEQLAWLLAEGLPDEAAEQARQALQNALDRMDAQPPPPRRGSVQSRSSRSSPAQDVDGFADPMIGSPAEPPAPQAGGPDAVPAATSRMKPTHQGSGKSSASQQGPAAPENSSTAQPGGGFPPPPPGAGPDQGQGQGRRGSR